MQSCAKLESKQVVDQYFETCINEYGKSLFNYIYYHVKHKQLAEDIYQEVLISAYSALPLFEERAKVRNWLYKIALNKCRDYWRKEKSANRFWEEKVYTYVEEVSQSEQPEESIIAKDTKKEIENTLQELPKMYRDPLILFYFQHKTLKEISTSADLPLSTVKTRMRRAKDRLRPIVEGFV